MPHFREPVLCSEHIAPLGTLAPLSNAPISLIEMLGTSVDGTSGIQGFATHFYDWQGPLAAGAAGSWIATATEGGAGAAAIDVDNSATYGVLSVLNDAADNDNCQLQLNGSMFKYVVGKRMWFGIRCSLDDVDLADLAFGLILESDTNMINTFPTDGIFFEKIATATSMDFHVRKNGTSTEDTAIDSAVMVDATMRTYQFYVDEKGNVHYYVDGVLIGAVAAGDANIVDDEDLTLAFQVQNGSAVARTLKVDWIYAYQER